VLDLGLEVGVVDVRAGENLLLVRTLSKSYGLAGLRVGYAVGAPHLVADLWAVKDICNLGRLPMAAATAALHDTGYWRRSVAEVVANRERLTAELQTMGWDVLPSGANFIFAIPPVPAAEVYEHLLLKKVLVRYFPRPSVRHGLRISVATGRLELSRLLDREPSRERDLVVLSGDVHFSYAMSARRTLFPTKRRPTLYQLVASPFKNTLAPRDKRLILGQSWIKRAIYGGLYTRMLPLLRTKGAKHVHFDMMFQNAIALVTFWPQSQGNYCIRQVYLGVKHKTLVEIGSTVVNCG